MSDTIEPERALANELRRCAAVACLAVERPVADEIKAVLDRAAERIEVLSAREDVRRSEQWTDVCAAAKEFFAEIEEALRRQSRRSEHWSERWRTALNERDEALATRDRLRALLAKARRWIPTAPMGDDAESRAEVLAEIDEALR